MAHDAGAVILVITHTERIPYLEAQIARDGPAGRVDVITFAHVADVLEEAIAVDGDRNGSLLAELLDDKP